MIGSCGERGDFLLRGRGDDGVAEVVEVVLARCHGCVYVGLVCGRRCCS